MYKLSIFIFSICCFINFKVFGQNEFTSPHKWNHSKIIKNLKSQPLSSIISMKNYLKSKSKKCDYSGKVYLVTLKNGLKAVFKSSEGYLAEIAAYKASRFLGFPFIPPTVIRRIRGEKGSLQFFVSTDIDALNFKEYQKALKNILSKDLANLKLFYFIFGQFDTGPHNILILKNKSRTFLIAIDNEGIRNRQFVRYGELPFVGILCSDKFNTNDWHQVNFPFENAQTIFNCDEKKLRSIFQNKVPEDFYSRFKNKKPFVFRYIIYQNRMWRQFHAFDKRFIKSYTEFFPEDAIKKLRSLDEKVLKKIFFDAIGSDFLTNKYLNSILDRRDQVLRKYKERLIKHIDVVNINKPK